MMTFIIIIIINHHLDLIERKGGPFPLRERECHCARVHLQISQLSWWWWRRWWRCPDFDVQSICQLSLYLSSPLSSLLCLSSPLTSLFYFVFLFVFIIVVTFPSHSIVKTKCWPGPVLTSMCGIHVNCLCLCGCLCLCLCLHHLSITLNGEDKVLARSSPDIDVRRWLLVKVTRIHYRPALRKLSEWQKDDDAINRMIRKKKTMIRMIMIMIML